MESGILHWFNNSVVHIIGVVETKSNNRVIVYRYIFPSALTAFIVPTTIREALDAASAAAISTYNHAHYNYEKEYTCHHF